MNRQLRGNAWRFAGLLDVDWEICPRTIDQELRRRGREATDAELGEHCMSVLDPTFAQRVQPGDFLVGEEGFGYGHDHFHACRSIKGCGVAAVLCESATAYFIRNSFNLGLVVLEIPGVFAATTTGDALALDLAAGTLTNQTTGWQAEFAVLPDFLLELLDAGGIYEIVQSGR
jgi:3-isopropylmalate dehydrogenase/3-isopropylmalate/(R)-2-methylmalate dehydratase small subunit